MGRRIDQHGQHEPIIAYDDYSHGPAKVIIDGRHRYKACTELGIDPIFAPSWQGNHSDITALVISLNLHRRHLSESQRAMLAAELKPLFEEEARKRQIAMAGNRPNKMADLSPNLDQGIKPLESAAEAAKLANVSRSAVFSAQHVLKHHSPEVAQAIKSGKVTLSDTANLDLLPESVRTKAVEMVDKNETDSYKKAVKIIEQQSIDAEQAAKDAAHRKADEFRKHVNRLIDMLAFTDGQKPARYYFEEMCGIEWILEEWMSQDQLYCIDRAIHWLTEFRIEYAKIMDKVEFGVQIVDPEMRRFYCRTSL